MRFKHRGLDVECDFTPKIAGTDEQPPEGGEVINLTWEVDDLQEVLEFCGLPEYVEYQAEKTFKETGKLLACIRRKVEDNWDLEARAYEAQVDA